MARNRRIDVQKKL